MDARNFRIRCPQLDLLRRDLFEAYGSLEDHDLFVTGRNPQMPANKVYLIHEAIAKHREGCGICKRPVFKSDQVDSADFPRQ